MDNRYLGNEQALASGLVISGGLKTPEHIKSGGYRLDFRPDAGIAHALFDMVKILERPNGLIGERDSWNYAVYQLTGTPYFAFYVHGRHFAAQVKRGGAFFEVHPYFNPHLHIKIGGYSSGIGAYLPYLQFLDPGIRISTTYGSNEYTGANQGQFLPIFSSTGGEKVKLPQQLFTKAVCVQKSNVRKTASTVAGSYVETLPAGAQVIISGYETGEQVARNALWATVIYGAKTGYIWTGNLKTL